MKKITFLSVIIALMLAITGCSEDKAKESKGKVTQENQKKIIDPDAKDKSDTVKNDDDLKKEFEKEKNVSQVSLLITEDSGGFAILDFEVPEKMKKSEAKKLADKFAKRLKDKYSEYSIDVQARKGGKTVGQTTLKKQ